LNWLVVMSNFWGADHQPYKLVILDKQGKIDFVGHYPTYEQAHKVAEFLKDKDVHSEIRISNPDGLGEEVEND
ncbi:hypothetical protein HYE60_01295, partial [Aggregatibacter actinomycetemcomitans]|nr:hypothetical protein [Aggregatibacter actinomycetemcomitans]